MSFFRLVVLVFFVSFAAQGQVPVEFDRGHLKIVSSNGQSHGFAIELALSHDQQAQGLMYRKSLATDAGMLFDFHAVKPVSMWMKNTFIPLDMIFIADDGVIVAIAPRTIPQSLDIISSPQAVRAVLEVNGGTASKLGIKAGDRVKYPSFGLDRE